MFKRTREREMKKLLTVLFAALMVFSLTACNKNNGNNGGTTPEPTDDVKVMSHEEYMAAPLDSEVVIETYVQAHQSWWDNKVTVYAASEDGAYFIYNMTATEEEAAKLVPGTKIRVTGYKTEWSGEVEVAEGATFEILEGSYLATPVDLTNKLGTDELINHQNELFTMKGLTVVGKGDNNLPFFFKYDNSGSHDENSDLYFDVEYNGNVYTFTVESYLTDNNSDVYKAVEMLNVGDVIDVEGFLYWYEGVNPHITAVTVH